MTAKRSVTFVWTSLLLVLFLAPCAAGAAGAPENATLPADDAWTESLDFLLANGRRGRGWTFRHEDKDRSLCKPVRGKTLLLDEVNKTTGKASVRFRYNSAEALRIRTDIPQPNPRQIYNVLRLPNPPVDATGCDAIEFDMRCVPEGAVTRVRLLVTQRASATSGRLHFLCGEAWRRFGFPLNKMAGYRGEAPDWSRCREIIIDVNISIEALKKSEYVDVWVDGLRFVKGKSAAAEKVAAENVAALAARRAAAQRATNPHRDAPVLEWEDLGVMVRGRTTVRGSPRLGLSTDKDGWSAYIVYRDHIVKRKPWQFTEVNLQTQKVKHFYGPPSERGDTWGLAVFRDGRPYTFPGGGSTKGARIARVDWKTGQLQIFGPCPDPWIYSWRWGAADEAIYMSGYRKHCTFRFDPETGEITDYGVQGPPVSGGVYGVGADDKYVYTSVGVPISYVVACDRKTGKQEIITQAEYPKKWTLNSYGGQVYARLWLPAGKDGKPVLKEHRLRHKKLEPITRRPSRPAGEVRTEAFGVPRPKVLGSSGMCVGDGTATLWYKLPGKEWQSVKYEVDDVPSFLSAIGLDGDGNIIGSSEDPYTIFTWNPRTGEKKILGPPPNITHVYDFLGHPNGKTYMCGYSGAPVLEWDPKKPWNYQPPTPEKPMLNWKDPKVNPLLPARIYRQRRSYAMTLAADGRLYVPCSAYVETIPGGCLGWFDPKTREAGLIREGFETWRGNDVCTASNGRYVVATTMPWPRKQGDKEVALTDPHDLVSTKDGFRIRYKGPDGATGKRITPEAVVRQLVGDRKSRTVRFDEICYVVTFDTKTQRIIGRLPIGSNGIVCEWKPGLVLVRVNVAGGGEYGLLDVKNQKFAFKMEVPGRPFRRLLVLPDGRVAAVHFDAIVFIDPADWSWKAVGRLRPLVKGKTLVPGDWMLVGDDLYLYCATQLARIKNIGALDRR